MISAWKEADLVKAAVESVPFAHGEDKERRAARVAARVGVSRSTLYNWMRESHGSRIGLNQLLRLLDFCPMHVRRQVLAKVSSAVDVYAEGNGKGDRP